MHCVAAVMLRKQLNFKSAVTHVRSERSSFCFRTTPPRNLTDKETLTVDGKVCKILKIIIICFIFYIIHVCVTTFLVLVLSLYL